MITTKSQSWDSITNHYKSLVSHTWQVEPMVELIKHIVAAYSDRLFAFTSLDKLIISIYENIDMQSESLHIQYDQEVKQFYLYYFGGHSTTKQPEWERTCDADDGIRKFDEFIKMINW